MAEREGGIQVLGRDLAYGIGTGEGVTSIGSFQGWIQSGTTSREGDSSPYKKNNGVTGSLVIKEQWQQVTFDILLFSGAGGKVLPKKGDIVEGVPEDIYVKDGSKKLRLESISVQWANEDVAKCSVTAREYPF